MSNTHEVSARRAGRPALLATAVLLLSAVVAVGVVTAARGGTQPSPVPVVSGCFAFTVHLNRSTFPSGAPIGFVVTARNISDHSCTGRGCGGVTPSYEIRDPLDRIVYRQNAAGVMCMRTAPPPPVIPAGGSTRWSVESWDGHTSWQGSCAPGNCRLTRPPAPAGRYRVVWHLRPDMSVRSAWFSLR